MAGLSKAATRPQRRARRRSAGERSNGRVQSLARALNILNVLSQAEQGMTLTDLVHTVGLAPSTAHRLLTTLQRDRFVDFAGDRNAWTVGVQAFIVGNGFLQSRDLVSIARPFMRRLMEDGGETVNLAVEDRGEAIFLAQVECRQMMRAITKPGRQVPIHGSAVGKALLAGMPNARVAKILQNRGLPTVTSRTIRTPIKLRRAFEEIRAVGYALDDEENSVGLRCVAAAVRDEYGDPLAAISVSGPTARITRERMPVLGAMVAAVADEITVELGGTVKSLR